MEDIFPCRSESHPLLKMDCNLIAASFILAACRADTLLGDGAEAVGAGGWRGSLSGGTALKSNEIADKTIELLNY